MPSHELIYFNGAGRAEAIRICLSAACTDFVDTRIQGSDWPTLKPTTPLGSIPVLKIDGIDHCQSVALLRYAGKLAGLYPQDPLEALQVDEALDTMNELMSKAPRAKDPTELKKLREEFQATTMTQYAKFCEGLIQASGGTGFCKTPSIADLGLWLVVKGIQSGNWDYVDPKFYEAYPGIIATCESISKHEKVMAYYASKT